MKHQVRWDEDNRCVRLILVGNFGPDEARVAIERMSELMEQHQAERTLVDHTASAGALSRETRAALKTHSRVTDGSLDSDAIEIAFFGMSNLNRIAAKMIVAITGHGDRAKFFKTEDEALAWFARA